MKLTKSATDKMKYQGDGSSRDIRWDSAVSGLGLRIYPTGKKAFVLSYRVNGRKRLMTLGAYGALTIQNARIKANQYLVRIEDGKDPLGERQRVAKGETIKDLCAMYIERHAMPRKRSWRDDVRRIERYIIPSWGNFKVINICRSDVASLHHKIGANSPYEANRLVRLISKMFSLACKWGHTPDNHPNPANGLDLFKEEKRNRWITQGEMPGVLEAIDNEDNEYARFAILMLLLTGMRKSEVLRLKWSDIDWANNLVHVAVTKSDKSHYRSIGDDAISILKEIPRIQNNPYVFPGLKEGSYLVNIDKAWRRIRKAAGITDVRLHDLRHTTVSWMVQSGHTLYLASKAVGHEDPNTTAIYAHFDHQDTLNALNAVSSKMLKYRKRPIPASSDLN